MKGLQLFILAILTLSLTSCFEIIEDITINKNGTGKIKLIINASQSKTDINALMLLKEVNGYEVPSIQKINTKLKSLTDSIANTKGFSNVTSSFDTDNFIIVVEADFDKVARLNNGIFKLWNRYDSQNAIEEPYFSYSNNSFYRQSGKLFNLLYLRLKTADRKVLDGATYTALYRFDELIESQKNALAIISKNQKVVFLKLPVEKLIENATNWNNTITLKP
ncbi:MAG: hypothetical protein AB8B74_08050 [Crocinitomicaceae bacterium]